MNQNMIHLENLHNQLQHELKVKTDKLNNAFDDLEQKFFDLRAELE